MSKLNKRTRVILYPNHKPFLVDLMRKNFENNEGLDRWNEDCVQLWSKIAPDVQSAKLSNKEIDTSLDTLLHTFRGGHLFGETIVPIVLKSYPGLMQGDRLVEAVEVLEDESENLGALKTVQLWLNLAMKNITEHKEHLSDFSDCYDCLVIQNALNTKISRMEAA